VRSDAAVFRKTILATAVKERGRGRVRVRLEEGDEKRGGGTTAHSRAVEILTRPVDCFDTDGERIRADREAVLALVP
jgi:hypothetical protein